MAAAQRLLSLSPHFKRDTTVLESRLAKKTGKLLSLDNYSTISN